MSRAGRWIIVPRRRRQVIDAIVKHSQDEKRAANALCVERFALCKAEQVQVSKVHQEL
jgi:hypothetical protein